MHFGQTLRVLRTTAGISLRELSKRLGLSPAYLSQVERGKQPPPKDEWIHKIERELDLPSGYLLGTTERLDSDVADFLCAVPEAADFIRIAKREGFGAAEFMEMTAFLQKRGRSGLRSMIREQEPARDGGAKGIPTVRQREDKRCLLPNFLQETLVFDLADCPDKKSLFRQLARRIGARVLAVHERELLERLWKREEVASTGVGGGIAVPHVALPGMDETILAIARIPGGMEYGSVDGKPVFLCFVLLGREAQRGEHLRLLARIAQLCRHPEFCEGVIGACDAAELDRFLRDRSLKIP